MSTNLPRGWKAGRFRDAVGIAEGRREAVSPTKTYKMLGVRWYGNGAFLREERVGETLSAHHVYKVQFGDVIYNRLFAWKGSFAIINEKLDGCHVSNEFPLFATKLDRVDPEFFLRVLNSPTTSKRADAFSTGTTSISRNRLNEEDFLHFPVLLPPVEEQRAIAEVLSALDRAIGQTSALITALGKAKHATMRELLTLGVPPRKKKLKKLSSRWVLGRVAEGLEAIPSDWDLVTLTSVAKLESGHTPSRGEPSYWGDDVSWLSLGDTDALDALTVTETAEKVSHKGLANSSARLLPVDTVIFSRTATVGKATRLAVPMATSQDFANWICGPEMNPRYLVQVFRHMQREWQRLQEGSTHQTIYMPVFQKLQVLKPPLSEQVKIADIGDAFDTRIATERGELSRLTACRAALAQELLSGRVRLPESVVSRHLDKPGKAA
jgi:type I restriction enzyme S subunit